MPKFFTLEKQPIKIVDNPPHDFYPMVKVIEVEAASTDGKALNTSEQDICRPERKPLMLVTVEWYENAYTHGIREMIGTDTDTFWYVRRSLPWIKMPLYKRAVETINQAIAAYWRKP